MSDPTNPLDAFLPATRAWFTQALAQPTPPQQQGWLMDVVGFVDLVRQRQEA